MATQPAAEGAWRALLNGEFTWETDRRRYALFPAKHRCKNCNAPFDGIGRWVARLAGRAQFSHNPRFCNF